MLRGFGYDVIMSLEGSIYVPMGVSNEEACLNAVEECDLFLGIIFPRYGSGITHKEFLKAIELDKPRWFITHHYVTFAREILRQYMFRGTRKNLNFTFKKTSMMDKVEVIDLYNDAIQDGIDASKRKSHWVQPFFKITDVHLFLETQFKPIERRREELEKYK